MKRALTAFSLALATVFNAAAIQPPAGFDLDPLARVPILEGGRHKPLQSFAGKTIETITGRWTFNGHDPVAYLVSIQAFENEWGGEPMILLDYKPLKELLGLDPERKHFSLNELLSNAELMRMQNRLREKSRAGEDFNTMENRAATLIHRINLMGDLAGGGLLTIVPPPPGSEEEAAWLSIGEAGVYGESVKNGLEGAYGAMIAAVRQDNAEAFAAAAESLKTQLAGLNPELYPAAAAIEREIRFNETRPFLMAWVLYLAAFLLFMASFALTPKIVLWSAWGAFMLGFGYNVYGFVMRWLIAGHPPVSNMYESVIFVGLGVVTIALAFEWIYRQRWFVTTASLMGVGMLVMADLMPFDSNIEPLMPVLRSNYWLVTHVMTVTLSYSAFALATALAHVVLFLYFFKIGKNALLPQLNNFLYRVLQVGAVMLAAGTILGGVWAAESWGRFWGWDPKETWALISLLGYMTVLHARHTGWLRNIGTAVCSILGFWLIIMTWYGVNFVLGTGLHSYGFGAGGGWYILGFLLFESAVLGVFGLRYYTANLAVEDNAPAVRDEAEELDADGAPAPGTM